MAEEFSVREEVIARAMEGKSDDSDGLGSDGAHAILDTTGKQIVTDIEEADGSKMSHVETDYNANSLRLLEGVEHVRQRPAMYIGDTGSNGLHHLLFEIVDNSVDEVLAGRASEIWVKLHKDQSISVRDNGNGIPTDINEATGLSGVELAMTKLNAGGKFGDGGYKVSGGLHGVGLSCVNFLSEWCEATVEYKGRKTRLRCEKGIRSEGPDDLGPTDGHGTTMHWMADPEIFGDYKYNSDTFEQRIRNTCYLTKEVTIHFHDELNEQEPVTYHFSRGIAELVDHLTKNDSGIGEVIYFNKVKDKVVVEVALQYNTSYTETVLSFANNVHTQAGGTHLSGFRTALTRVINQYAKKIGAIKEGKDQNLSGDDVREGLTAVISIRLGNPQFEGQTKAKLGNSEVEGIVNSITGESLTAFLEENPQVGKRIVDKAITSQRARDAARKAAELIKRQSSLENSNLPGKLADCTEKDPKKCEIFLVEGDSAGGSAKTGRDRRYQAILPLRGKIINVGKAALDKTLENNEVRSLITALGIGIKVDSEEDDEAGESTSKFDMSRLRYDRIVIMTDADVDGDHIRTLLLTFFFEYMRPLIAEGHVYIAQPPLFSIKSGKDTRVYAKDEAERDRIIRDMKRKDVSVGRFKGLGEMNPEELYETTMNIDSRTISRVSMEDAETAAELFSILMSEKVEPRKQFIIRHAKQVQNVDWHC